MTGKGGKTEKKPFPFSFEDFRKRGAFICGAKQSGKTNLAKLIANELKRRNFVVRAFDPSQAWLKSSLPYFLVFRSADLRKTTAYPFDLSAVFDISRLLPSEQQETVRQVLATDFAVVSEKKPSFGFCYALEEAQLYLPTGSLQASVNQQTLRMVSVGGNFGQTCLILTQRPADVSAKAIGRVGQLFVGKHFEENDIAKLARYLGWLPKKTYEKLTKLEIGQFYYLMVGEEPELISTPLFEPETTPKRLTLFPKGRKR